LRNRRENRTIMRFFTKIIEHKLKLYNRALFDQFMIKCKDGEYTMEIEPRVKGNNRHNTYRGYIRDIANETGESVNVVHNRFKEEFLTPTYVMSFGKEVKILTTTTLNKEEFWIYMGQIQALTGYPYRWEEQTLDNQA